MPSLFILAQLLGFTAYVNAHCSLTAIYGSNNQIGHAFGVNLYGEYPRKLGQPGDAGGDAGIFETGTNNPNPPCGSTPGLGELDLDSWLNQAENSGLPAAYANGSIVANVFQVNRDGGGPMTCEYNEDGTATSFKPMTMTLDQVGILGVRNENRFNSTVVMTFPKGAKCTGGWTGTACIVRCRTGVNKRFGGCFAAKLPGTTANSLMVTYSSSSRSTTFSLTTKQITQVAMQVVAQMKSTKHMVSKSALAKPPMSSSQPTIANFFSRPPSPSQALTTSQVNQIANQVMSQMQSSGYLFAK